MLPGITLGGFLSTLSTHNQSSEEGRHDKPPLALIAPTWDIALLLKTHHMTTPGFKGMGRSSEYLEEKRTETL